VLSKIDDIGFSYLTSVDVVRHPLVQRIVKAYDAYEEKLKQQAVRAKLENKKKLSLKFKSEKIRGNRYEKR